MVVSSAKLQTSASLMKIIKSLIKMLNRIGAKIEPYETPLNISR